MPKSTRTRLTVARVADLKAPREGQRFAWDADVGGLGVRVTSHGAKSFIFERSFNSKTLRLTIGATSAWSLSKAREEARRLQRLIDRGIDPRKERAAQKAVDKVSGMVVSDVWEAYLEVHKSQWGPRHMKDHHYLSRAPSKDKTTGVLYPLLKRKLADIDTSSLVRWVQDMAKMPARSRNNQGRGSAVRQGFMCFKTFWSWAHGMDEYCAAMVGPEIFNNRDLKALIPKRGTKSDVLEKSQLKVWFKHVQKIDNRVIAAYLQSLLLLGCRRNELASLRWSNIDFRWKKIRLHDKIETDGRVVPLPPYVEFIISPLPRKNEFVFSSPTSASGHLEEPRIAHKRALEGAGLPSDLSLHGLRRSFATLSEWVEMPAGITAQIQGHRPSAVQERHYKRRPLDLLAKWHGKFEVWILEQAGIAFDPKKAKKGLRVV